MEDEPIVETGAAVVEPTIVELDQITEANADDSIVDDKGVITESFDREKNVRYVLKGSQPKKVDQPEKTEAELAEAKRIADEGAAASEDGSKDDIEDFINPADYVLKKSGYKKDEVDLGDGKLVKIADLTAEQQMDLVITEYDNQAESYLAKIKELEEREPDLTFDDPLAQQMLDYLKEGGDVKKLAREILTKDPAAQAKMLSDEDIVKLGIQKEFSEYTPEEVDEEFKEMSPEKVARRAKALRTKMEKEKPDLSNLTEAQKGINAQAELVRRQQFETESGNVKKAASELKEIGGIPISEQVRTFLVSRALPKDADSDSAFVTSLQNNPKKILELEFWTNYGAKLLKSTEQFYYEKGLADGSVGKEKLSDEPVRIYSGSGSKEVKKVTKSVTELEGKELQKFLDGEGF